MQVRVIQGMKALVMIALAVGLLDYKPYICT